MAIRASALLGVSALLAACGGATGEPAIGVASAALSTGDAIAWVRSACADQLRNHGDCESCVAHAVGQLREAGLVAGDEGGEVVSWYAHRTCCRPLGCSDVGATCGTVDDSCGGTVDCGACAAPSICFANVCVIPPQISTDGR
jgi:hypothetical protein